MQSSSIPAKVAVPFADGGGKNTIPVPSQPGGAASFTDGFPALTRTPLAGGGIPPSGLDMNGILNIISAWARWVSAGGVVPYDATFSAAIGGYPKGATLINASDPTNTWISTVDNNTTNPDAAGAGWVSRKLGPAMVQLAGTGNFVVPAGVTRIKATLHGGGGGGGGSNGSSSAGSGGSGGGRVRGILTVTPGQTLAYTVGAGGARGSTAGGPGGGGGNTTIGGLTAGGGGAGLGASAGVIAGSPGAPGGATGGVEADAGLGGGTGYLVGGGGILGGAGGASPGYAAPGAPNSSTSAPQAGSDAFLPGCGGAGGVSGGNGGLGAPGRILLEWT